MTHHKPMQVLDQAEVVDNDVLLQQGMQAVETLMREVVNSDVPVLRDASHHILEAGGKRVRPRLALLSYLAVGGQQVEDVAPIAAAIEMMHTASVVHDDINDHGVLRRGRPSVNAIWGRTFALLTGDFLFTKVYELMAPYKDLNILLANAAVALVEGETLQASAVKENRLTREVYMDVIGRKTAALFDAAGRMGALLAGASDSISDALGQYGYKVGLAFQIIDDVLDLTVDSEKLGKTAGIDAEQGKGFASVQTESADPMESIKRKLLQGDAIQKAREQAIMLVHTAIADLEIVPDSTAKTALIELAHSVVAREN